MSCSISLSDGFIDIAAWHPDKLIILGSFIFVVKVELELAIGYIFERCHLCCGNVLKVYNSLEL